MLFVALSALQGRPMTSAFDELRALDVHVQLTPGNHPTPGFREHVARSGVPTRTHHGFAWDARRTPTWGDDGACLVASESVHPPKTEAPAAATWWQWYEAAPSTSRPALELMYPGYALGDGAAIERVLAAGWPIAVDVSHAFIQRTQGAMTEATWRRVMEHDRIVEVHVSANAGTSDAHQPITADSFGLAWARERLAAGTPVVVECYMHRLDGDARRRQLALVREGR